MMTLLLQRKNATNQVKTCRLLQLYKKSWFIVLANNFSDSGAISKEKCKVSLWCLAFLPLRREVSTVSTHDFFLLHHLRPCPSTLGWPPAVVPRPVLEAAEAEAFIHLDSCLGSYLKEEFFIFHFLKNLPLRRFALTHGERP